MRESSSQPDLMITVDEAGMITFHSAPGQPHDLRSNLDLFPRFPVLEVDHGEAGGITCVTELLMALEGFRYSHPCHYHD